MEPGGDVQLHIIMTSNLMDEVISYSYNVYIHLYLVITTSQAFAIDCSDKHLQITLLLRNVQ